MRSWFKDRKKKTNQGRASWAEDGVQTNFNKELLQPPRATPSTDVLQLLYPFVHLAAQTYSPFFPNPVGQLSPLPCQPLGNGSERCCWGGENCIPAIVLKGYSCQTHCVCGNTCWVAVAVGRARWRKTAVKVPAAVGSSTKTALCQLDMCQIIWPHFKYLGVHSICQLALPGNTSALTPLLPCSRCSSTLISACTALCFFYF